MLSNCKTIIVQYSHAYICSVKTFNDTNDITKRHLIYNVTHHQIKTLNLAKKNMPKKYKYVNQKAAAALARKAAMEEQRLARERQELEEMHWREEDKHVLRKQQRKVLREQKRQQTLEKKAENRVLLARENANLKGRKPLKPKLTRIDIEVVKLKKDNVEQVENVPLQENINRNGNRVDVEVQARSVAEAIAVLKVGPEVQTDKNPEKRVRSTFKSYEQTRLGKLRRENPGLRLSQVKQLVVKEWEKCRLNPMNRIDVY